jgi:hypothetical protein
MEAKPAPKRLSQAVIARVIMLMFLLIFEAGRIFWGEVEFGRFDLVALGGGHCGHAGTQSAEPDCDDKGDHVGFSCWSVVVFVLHCCSAWVYYYYSTPHVSNTFFAPCAFFCRFAFWG